MIPAQKTVPPGAAPEGLARTGAVSFVLVMTGSAFAFATTLLVSNLIGDAGAGIFFQITALYAITTALCTLGADTGLVRFLSAGRALGRYQDSKFLILTALIPVAVLSVAIAGSLWWAVPHIQEATSATDDTASGIRAAAPFIVFGSIMTVLFGALRGNGQIVRFALLQNIILPLLRLGGIVGAIWLGTSVFGLSAAWTVPVLVVALLAATMLLRGLRKSAGAHSRRTDGGPSVDAIRPSVRAFWSFSGARGVSAAVEVLLEWVDVLAVALFLGPAEAGVYGVINRCIRLGSMLDHTARIVSGPSLSEALATGDVRRAGNLFNAVTRMLVLGAWPLYLIYICFGEAVMSLFGDGFENGSGIFVIIAASMLLVVSAGGVQSVLLMSGRSRWQLINKLTSLAVAITLNLILVPAFGLLGAVIAWSAASLVDTGMAAFQVRFFLGIGLRFDVVLLPAALAMGAFGLGGWVIRLFTGPTLPGLLLLLGCGGLAYIALLAALRERLGLSWLSAKPRLPNPS